MWPGNGFIRSGGGIAGTPENGTTYIQTGLGDSLVFSFINGGLFDLLSVDLAEYCTVVPDAATVRFTGYRSDGSTVTRDFTTTASSTARARWPTSRPSRSPASPA